jgi:hypothetical protein
MRKRPGLLKQPNQAGSPTREKQRDIAFDIEFIDIYLKADIAVAVENAKIPTNPTVCVRPQSGLLSCRPSQFPRCSAGHTAVFEACSHQGEADHFEGHFRRRDGG